MAAPGRPALLGGLDVLAAGAFAPLRGRTVGLVTHQAAVDRYLRRAVDVLASAAGVRLAALFAPEHGLGGAAAPGEPVADAHDAPTGLPVHSLYGPRQTPDPAALRGLDSLVFDLQDVGARPFTYLATLLGVLEAAAAVGLEVVVLDRPNPLGGARVEGPPLRPGFTSFVGAVDVPLRHGLTLGEAARLLAAERGWPEPRVVPVRGWRRARLFASPAGAWVPPSPNLPGPTAAILYPGVCLLEGTPISEGRGTPLPFQVVGAPWLDPFRLATDLAARGLPGVGFRPVWFVPTASKHAGVACGGVQIHVFDPRRARPVALGTHLLEALRAASRGRWSWLRGEDGRYALDLLAGGDDLRHALEAGTPAHEIAAGWRPAERAFRRRRQPFLLYH